ncbi:MAG: DNA mismatch repair protein MutS [Acidobacteria bacterium]|nr:MAG: DNA mismatch repair protein MutS [Acidobacteriota bacterium]
MSRPTPMFQQYHDIKSRHQDAILMFRMGDFYEMFHDDALEAARTLQITLTTRGKGSVSEAPMCGVPFHAVDGYIARLTQAGYKVAICEQLEDPATVKGLVKRDVVRVVTPGTVTDSRQLEAGEPNSLGALKSDPGGWGVAWVDLSTGDFRLARFSGPGAAQQAAELLARFNCREILIPEEEDLAGTGSLKGVLVNKLESWRFGRDRCREALTSHFGTAHLAGFGVEEMDSAIGAAGALLGYLRETQKAELVHLDRLRRFNADDHLLLDETTVTNLELLRTQREGRRRGSLLGLLDRTVTGMGGRLLKERLLHPLRDPAAIHLRLAAVADLAERGVVRATLRGKLKEVGDLERLLSRLTLGSAGPRDVRLMGLSLARLAEMVPLADEVQAEPLRDNLSRLDPVPEVEELARAAIADEPPATVRDGGLIRDGYDAELDELRTLGRDGKRFLAELEARERQATGIATLKVRYNRVFGYFIEVSKANTGKVPDHYQRRQTLAGAERYATPELKELEEKVLTARDRSLTRESDLFEDVRRRILAHAPRLRTAAHDVARLDVASALAEVGSHLNWCVPEVDSSLTIKIEDGRHPVVEEAVGSDRFVPNAIHLDGGARQIQIITGPNMGGKSTVLRQVAIIVLLAQTGSLVPAGRAHIGVADRIFCRVGASDSLASGHSTFMVEMTETANILHNATPASLVLLDEIGRGTATFDGLSIAWAVVEHLHEVPQVAARTLFATHYHELTELALVLPRVVNLRMTAREHEGRIIFLHRLEEGAADQSYGIQVAALAGVPPEVVGRAREILHNLEAEAVGRDGRPRLARHAAGSGPGQLALFGARPAVPKLGGKAAALARAHTDAADKAEQAALRGLREIRVETMTPLEALQTLERLTRNLCADKPMLDSPGPAAANKEDQSAAASVPSRSGPVRDV